MDAWRWITDIVVWYREVQSIHHTTEVIGI